MVDGVLDGGESCRCEEYLVTVSSQGGAPILCSVMCFLLMSLRPDQTSLITERIYGVGGKDD